MFLSPADDRTTVEHTGRGFESGERPGWGVRGGFGPVLSIIPFEDDEEAVEIANDTIYGLASGVWTSNIRRAFTMADRIRAGTVWIDLAEGMANPFVLR